MYILRMAAVALVTACGSIAAAAPGAAASNSSEQFAQATVTARVIGGTSARASERRNLTTRLTITRFESRAGQLQAVGTLKFRVSGRSFAKTVRFPAEVRAVAQATQIPPTPNACTILNLTLQPIDLNLLGLRIRTSRIDVLIEGVRGPGNLLGNLLCALTGILNPPDGTQLTAGETAQVLNAILALQPRPTTG